MSIVLAVSLVSGGIGVSALLASFAVDLANVRLQRKSYRRTSQVFGGIGLAGTGVFCLLLWSVVSIAK